MLDVNKFVAAHTMITSDNAKVGMKVLFNKDGGEFIFREGVISSVELNGKKAVVVITSEDAEYPEAKFTVKRKEYYDKNPLSVDKGPIPYINGEHSNIYLK